MNNRFSNSNIGSSLVKLLMIIILLSALEDLLRRLIPEIPSTVLLLKTVLLILILLAYYPRFNTNIFNKRTVNWSLLLLLITLPHLISISGVIRSVLWYHAVFILPFIITSIIFQLSERQYFRVTKFVFFLSLTSALFAFINYFTGIYSEDNILGSVITGGFRYFEGEKLYFNAGWFFGAERLAWFCAIGIASGFIIIFSKKTMRQQYLIYAGMILILIAAYTTARVTGFLLIISLFSFLSLSLFLKNKGWLLTIFLISSLLILNFQEILKLIGSDTRSLFFIEHASTLEDRGAFHFDNIVNAIKYSPVFGLGPMPQGLQYLDFSNQVFTWFHVEGLISLSIMQFGTLSIFHISFNFMFLLLALRAIKRYNDYRFVLGFLLLVLKIWILKASQMETDTFAQFFLYVMVTPLIKSYYFELRQRKKRILLPKHF